MDTFATQRPVTTTDSDTESQTFPTGFRWGVATAAYQIEGAADEGGREPSIWDTFSRVPGNIVNGDTGDVACDHYHRFQEDIALMESIGVTDYRLSISWSRLLTGTKPESRGRGLLSPFAHEPAGSRNHTLGHPVPLGLAAMVGGCGWMAGQGRPHSSSPTMQWRPTPLWAISLTIGSRSTSRSTLRCWDTPEEFMPLVERALSLAWRLPITSISGTAWPPARFKERDPTAQVGPTFLLTPVHPATSEAADQAAAVKLDGVLNRLFLDPVFRSAYPDDLLENVERYGFSDVVEDGDLEIIAAPVDFLGVNYYFRVVASSEPQGSGSSFDWRRDAWVGCEDVYPVEVDGVRTEMGWEIYPDGLTEVLTRVSRDYTKVPIYITESGAAFADDLTPDAQVQDHNRVDYMRSHISRAKRAIDQGVDLRGYFAWSLLDNFEWTFGYAKRFGLVHVDFETQVRTPKQSAAWYRELIVNNGLAI